MATSHHYTVIIDDALAVFLVEEEAPTTSPNPSQGGEFEHLPQQGVGLCYGFRFFLTGLVDGEG